MTRLLSRHHYPIAAALSVAVVSATAHAQAPEQPEPAAAEPAPPSVVDVVVPEPIIAEPPPPESTSVREGVTARAGGPDRSAPEAAPEAAAPVPVEVTVSGTRIGRLRDEAPAAISIVTRKDFEKRHALTFDEGLRREPGVFVLKFRGPVDNHTITVMRGLTGQNRTLTMLDGIPLNGVAGGEIPWANLPVDTVDRIELGRGPFSALYGGYAMAGVVNASTVTPQTDSTVVRAGYGSHGTQQLSGTIGTRVLGDRLAVLLSAERYASDGYEVQQTRKAAGSTPAMDTDPVVTGWTASTDVTGQQQFIIGSPGKNAFTRDAYLGKLAYEVSPRTTVSVLGLYGQWSATNPSYRAALRDASGAPVVSGPVNIDGKRIMLSENDFNPIERSQNAAIVGARLSHELGGGNTLSSTLAFTRQFSEEVEFRVVPTDINPSGRNWTTRRQTSSGLFADVNAAIQLGSANTLTAGVVAIGADGEQRIPLIVNRHERTVIGSLAELGGQQMTAALYAQDELRLADNLRVYGGLRLDWWHNEDGYRAVPPAMPGDPAREDFGSRNQTSINPKLSVVYLPTTDTTLRASVGSAFRAPTITELYGGTAHAGTQTFGDPSLRPETIRSVEVGAVKRFGATTRIAATAFYSDIDRLIFARTISAPGDAVTVRVQDNAAEVRSRGAELELRHAVVRGLEVFGNYTFTRSTFRSFPGNPAAEGKRLPNVPEHMVNAGVDLKLGKLSGLVTVEGVGDAFAREDNSDTARGVPQGIDPYWVVDAKLGYQVLANVRASAAAQNLFDKHYFLSFGQSAGRTLFGDVSVTF